MTNAVKLPLLLSMLMPSLGCRRPIQVTYEVTSNDVQVANVGYWESPGKNHVLKEVKLPFKKTVPFPEDRNWSTNVSGSVPLDKQVTCTVSFDGRLMRTESKTLLCIVNAHYDLDRGATF